MRVENLIADYLSRIENDGVEKSTERPVNDSFPDELLYAIEMATTP